MKRFFKDIKRYNPYAVYSAKADLKSSVADSYLNWLWWILDPILFMLVYSFLAQIVFNSREDNFAVFVFIGLTAWDFFNRTITNSVKLVKGNKSTVIKIYIPKYTLILSRMYLNGFKMLISFGLVIASMIISGITVTWNILYLPLILAVLFVITFGFSTIFMHFGVFIEDLANVVAVLLRLLFYVSGVFYSIGDKLEKFSPLVATVLSYGNPIALTITSLRDVMLYGQAPNVLALLIWLVFGTLVSVLGVSTVYKYENSYTKVI